MKTLIIRVRDVPDGRPWPVELYFDNGTQDWFRQPEATGSLSRTPGPVQLPPMAGGGSLEISDIVRFFLSQPVPVSGYMEIGQSLYGLLHESGIGPAWDELHSAHSAPKGEGLRTVVEIEPVTLKPLPWETLTTEARQACLLDPANPFLRGPIDHLARVDPYLVPLRILVVVGDPQDSRLKWREEVEAIRTGLLTFKGKAEAKFMLGPTPTQLIAETDTFTPDIFHFIGHGIESTYDLGSALVFNNDKEGRRELTGPGIRSLLRTSVGRLAVLNACRTDQAASLDEGLVLSAQTWSLAQDFHEAGYRAVIGMQGDIPAAASVAFARTLYQQIGAGKAIDVAVAQARRRIGDDRSDVSVPSLLLRDWVLPSLLVSVPPDQVLASRYGVTSEVLDRIDRADEFREIEAFVDRSETRRDVWSRLEAKAHPDVRELILVHGENKLGKTSLVRFALRTCAWRGRNVYYVRFPDHKTLTLLDVLRTIRDGSSGSFISPGLPPAAFDRLNHDLSFLSRGKRPQQFEFDPAKHPLAEQCSTWEPGPLVDQVFSSLIDVLLMTAGDAPLIVALDQLEKVDDSVLRQLAEYFLRPIARGDLKSGDGKSKSVRVVVVFQSFQLRQSWWPDDLTRMTKSSQGT